MGKFHYLLLGLTILLIAACGEDDEGVIANQFDYLIFGHFYGECIGEQCLETFKLTEEKLYEDVNDNYGGTNFDFVELSNELFEEVQDLRDDFPSQLLDEEEEVLGCPDCADQGGLLIQYSDNGDVQSWRIDQSKNAVPAYLHDFMDKVNAKIDLLSN